MSYIKHHRPARVSELIKRELGLIIGRELEFPGILATISVVEVDKKLEWAKIKFSVWPAERGDEVLIILKRSQRRLHHSLLKKINIKPMPRIDFEIDKGQEKAANIEKLLLKSDNK